MHSRSAGSRSDATSVNLRQIPTIGQFDSLPKLDSRSPAKLSQSCASNLKGPVCSAPRPVCVTFVGEVERPLALEGDHDISQRPAVGRVHAVPRRAARGLLLRRASVLISANDYVRDRVVGHIVLLSYLQVADQ